MGRPRSTGSFGDTEEGRAFLQRRTGRFGLFVGGLSLAFLVFRASRYLTGGDPSELLQPQGWGHLLACLALLGLYAVHARGARSAGAVYGTELAALGLACLGYGLMALDIPQVSRPDFTLLLIFGTMILARAIYVPSTWQRTAVLAALVGAVLLLSVYLVFRELEPATRRYFAERSLGNAGIVQYLLPEVAAWWVVIATLAASASAVIYGLRREVGKAQRLGQYTLVRKIGEGGMGMVFEAKHAMLRRPTAVKLLLPDRVGVENLERFEREVCATACLTHPNTVTVYDHGRTPDGIVYYAMEYIDGATLAEAVSLAGPMPPARAVALVHQVAGALAEAHASGVIHRDIKPDNVLICERGGIPDVAKVVDFGLVKPLDATGGALTREETLVGTPLYMAPEAIRGEATIDARSDLYSVGALLYFLLTGEHVFTGKTVVEVCSQHLMAAPVPPSERLGHALPEDLEALVLRCLAKARDERPASAQALADALEGLGCWGEWTRADAQRWWRDYGPELRARQRPPDGASSRTLDVDLRRRAP